MTSAVNITPKSRPKTESQSRRFLENNFEKLGQCLEPYWTRKIDDDEVSKTITNRKPWNRTVENSENYLTGNFWAARPSSRIVITLMLALEKGFLNLNMYVQKMAFSIISHETNC